MWTPPLHMFTARMESESVICVVLKIKIVVTISGNLDEVKDTEVAGHHPTLSTQNPDKLALMVRAFPVSSELLTASI